jgi:muramoyltetrapeptide carboxypeptidase
MAGPTTAQRPRLRPGDRVAVVAPSGAVDEARLHAGCVVLEALGLDVVLGDHVFDRVPPSFAGSDADRAADLASAWCDPTVRGVICARGGHGATRLLELLDWRALAAAGPKVLHGASDITALHVAFGQRLGITTSFGSMVAGALADGRPEDLAALRDALFGVGPLRFCGARALVPGVAAGRLVGGTLSLLTALLGTPDAPAPVAGRIVFLEDVGEAPYRVDRMLTQLLRAGVLAGVAGFALGSWTNCGDPVVLEGVLLERLSPLGVPILAGLDVGHGARQQTLELGAAARLDTELRVLELAGALPQLSTSR